MRYDYEQDFLATDAPRNQDNSGGAPIDTQYYRRLAKLSFAANMVLGGSAIVCILAWLYFLYYYVWTQERHFTGSVEPVVCYFVLPLTAVLLTASLRSSACRKIKLSFVWLLACVSIYAVEIILAFTVATFPPKAPTIWPKRTKEELKEIVATATQNGVEFDTRSVVEFIADLRQRGVSAVPAIQPMLLSKSSEDGAAKSIIEVNGNNILPLAGISHRTTVLCNEGKHVLYESDRYGFHNPDELWESARVDIMALGDSQTHGVCVPSDKNFVALIRRKYPATLNLGVIGQGPLLTLATLKEYAQELKPKKVLWFFFGDSDFADLSNEKRFPLLIRYLERGFSQNLPASRTDIDRALERYAAQPENEIDFEAVPLALKRIFKLSNVRARLFSGPGDPHASEAPVAAGEIELVGKILSEAKATVEGWEGVLYLVYLPGHQRYVDRRTVDQSERNRQLFLRMAGSISLPVIDIYSAFDAERDPLSLFSLRRFRHYNEEGHRVIAKYVLESLFPENAESGIQKPRRRQPTISNERRGPAR